jgi:hypothetical protein
LLLSKGTFKHTFQLCYLVLLFVATTNSNHHIYYSVAVVGLSCARIDCGNNDTWLSDAEICWYSCFVLWMFRIQISATLYP